MSDADWFVVLNLQRLLMAEFDLPYKPVTTAEFEVILIKYNAKAF